MQIYVKDKPESCNDCLFKGKYTENVPIINSIGDIFGTQEMRAYGCTLCEEHDSESYPKCPLIELEGA